MMKKGGMFLILLLGATSVFAQEALEQMFRPDNPNLINLNEPREYTGSPLVYIEGVKAPEKANNEMEELQLQVFGTKKVQEVSKNTLELSQQLPEAPVNQLANFIFQNPFNQTIKAAFVHHVPSFMVVVQVLDQNTVLVSENVTVMNTDENLSWVRKIPLHAASSAVITGYSQNGQDFTFNLKPQKDMLVFESSKPMNLGPNQITLTYQLDHPFEDNNLDLEITGLDFNWPIEQFKTLFLFPVSRAVRESKLTFGKNRLDIPDIYTQQADGALSKLYFDINRIVPPKASIQANLKLDLSKIPVAQAISWKKMGLYIGLMVLVLYWIAFAWWNKYFAKPLKVSKVKRPRNVVLFSVQTGAHLSDEIWDDLVDFYKATNEPIGTLNVQYKRWKKHPYFETVKGKLKNFFLLTFEVFLGSFLLLGGILLTGSILTHVYLEENIPAVQVSALVIFIILGCVLLYFVALKRIRTSLWQKYLGKLSSETVMAGLTLQQIKQIYPLFILTGKSEQWREKLNQINPISIQKVHLS